MSNDYEAKPENIILGVPSSADAEKYTNAIIANSPLAPDDKEKDNLCRQVNLAVPQKLYEILVKYCTGKSISRMLKPAEVARIALIQFLLSEIADSDLKKYLKSLKEKYYEKNIKNSSR